MAVSPDRENSNAFLSIAPILGLPFSYSFWKTVAIMVKINLNTRSIFLNFLTGVLFIVFSVTGLIAEPEISEQGPVILSNEATYDPEKSLFTAVGDVELYFDGWQLFAPKVTFNSVTDRVLVEGSFELVEPDGSSVTYGNFADLSLDRADGIILAVKHVVEKYLEINAAEVNRDGERYSKFKAVRASTCKVCKASNTPLWELVAAEAIHDKKKKTVTYRNAKLFIRGFPVAYTPWVRVPDPSVDRASGFLFPKFRANSVLGTQAIVPYFQTLGKSADLTVSPNISLRPVASNKKASNTLEARYRQRLSEGYVELNGAISSPTGTSEKIKGYLFSNGNLQLPYGYQLKFQTQDASDKSYLGTYNFFPEDRYTFSGEPIQFVVDRLSQRIELSKNTIDDKVQFTYEHFDPLLSTDYVYDTANTKLNFHWLKSIHLGQFPGVVTISTVGQKYENDYGSTNLRQEDISRGSINFSWSNKTQISDNINFYNDLGVLSDTYSLDETAISKKSQSAVSHYGASKLELPLTIFKSEQQATTLTPSVQITSFDMKGFDLPDADGSTITLRDPFNVANLSRFERIDRSQNFNHAVSHVTLELPIQTTFWQSYVIGASIVSDEIIKADNNYPLSSGYIYKTKFEKLGGRLNFSFDSRFNEEGEQILNSVNSRLTLNSLSFGAAYLKKEENQVFYITEEQENWSLDLTLDLVNYLSIKMSTKVDEVNQGESKSSAQIVYDDKAAWYLKYNTVFSRFENRFDGQSYELHRRFAGGEGDLFYKFNEKLEISKSREFGISYTNECVKFETSVKRYEDITAESRSIDEISVSIILGSFGLDNKKRCG